MRAEKPAPDAFWRSFVFLAIIGSEVCLLAGRSYKLSFIHKIWKKKSEKLRIITIKSA